jgi:hypothetical protein
MSVSSPFPATIPSEPLRRGPAASAGGVVTSGPRLILRLEGAAVLAAASAAYAQLGAGWPMFALFFLVPDVSMLGYLLDRRIGAVIYNLGHSYVAPIGVGALGVLISQHLMSSSALIWLAHIGFDRMLGYGLKYSTAFGHTHLGLVGRERA